MAVHAIRVQSRGMRQTFATTEKGKAMSDYIVHRRKNRADKVIGELVRCKECRYWNTSGCRDGVGECEWAYYMTKPDDFCSYGERKESE